MERQVASPPDRLEINNILVNGDFNFIPDFVAEQVASGWIDGSASGSVSNDIYRWRFLRNVDTVSVRFDSQNKLFGKNSLKISTLDTSGAGLVRMLPTTNSSNALKYGVPVLPNTSYVVSVWIKMNNVKPSGFKGQWVRFAKDGSTIGSDFNLWTNSGGNQDWTLYETVVTTEVNDRFMELRFANNSAGNISDIWFANASITFSPPISRNLIQGPYRTTINNILKVGGLDYVPPFTAPTTGNSSWIDGTATGSSTDDKYGWMTGSAFSGATSAQFDTDVFYKGKASMKLVASVAVGGANGGAIAICPLVSPSINVQKQQMIKVTPSTSYTLKARIKTSAISKANNAGARVRVGVYSGESTSSTGFFSSDYINETHDWTEVTVTFTTPSNGRYANVWMQIDNETGTAWFDDLRLYPTSGIERSAI